MLRVSPCGLCLQIISIFTSEIGYESSEIADKMRVGLILTFLLAAAAAFHAPLARPAVRGNPQMSTLCQMQSFLLP